MSEETLYSLKTIRSSPHSIRQIMNAEVWYCVIEILLLLLLQHSKV